MWKFCDLGLGRFKVIQGQNDGAKRQHMDDFLFDTSIDPNIVSVTNF